MMWRLWQGLNAETIRRVLCDLQLVMGAAQPCCCEETQPKAQDELDARAFRFHSSGFLFPQGQSTVDLNRFNCLRFEIFIEFQWSWNISPGSYCQGIVMLIFEQRTKILMMLQEEADSKWFNDSKSVDVLAFLEYTVHYLIIEAVQGSIVSNRYIKSLTKRSRIKVLLLPDSCALWGSMLSTAVLIANIWRWIKWMRRMKWIKWVKWMELTALTWPKSFRSQMKVPVASNRTQPVQSQLWNHPKVWDWSRSPGRRGVKGQRGEVLVLLYCTSWPSSKCAVWSCNSVQSIAECRVFIGAKS